MGFSDFERLL